MSDNGSTKEIKSEKYQEVFIHKSTVRQDEECYSIRYRGRHGRQIDEHIGCKNEGYTEEDASRIRTVRIQKVRHPKKYSKPMSYVPILDEVFELFLHDRKEKGERNPAQTQMMWDKLISPALGKLRLDEVSAQMISDLQTRQREQGGLGESWWIEHLITSIYYFAWNCSTVNYRRESPMCDVVNPPENQLIQRIEEISRLLKKMKLEWLEPYLFVAVGLFKGKTLPKTMKDFERDVESDKIQKQANLKMEGTMKSVVEFKKFMGGIELIRDEIFAELPAQQIIMLLIVAEREGIDQQDFQKLLGVPAGTVSRNLARLGCKIVVKLDGEQEDVGYGLLEVRPHPTDSKSNQVFLSKKGRSFVEKLSSTLRDK